MLALSQTTGYAIRALCCIQQAGRLILARDIAARTGVPKPYLSKILNSLARSNLILAKRGYCGGFRLALDAGRIRLLDIVQAVEGLRWRPRCLLGLEECSDERACPTHEFWKAHRAQIERELARLSLADLAEFEARAQPRSNTPARAQSAKSNARAPRRTRQSPRPGRRSWTRGVGPRVGLLFLMAWGQPTAAQSGAATAPVLPRPAVHVDNCAQSGCHAGLAGQAVVHGPVARRQCQACHAELDVRQHTFRDAMARDRMCFGCHELPTRDISHQPVAVGDCTACHDPHGSAYTKLLRSDPATTLCVTCHEGVGHKKHTHGPVAAGACILCHDAHSSWVPGLLKQRGDELCVKCHEPVRQSIRSLRHAHPPAADGHCLACHDPHASDFPAQLRAGGEQLCGQCHGPTQYLLRTAAVKHGAAAGPDGCVGCHVGHASNLPKLQRLPQPDACLACHDRPLQDAAGRTLADMKQLLTDNPNHHGPIRDGNCTACHDPHGAANPRLLSTAYPPDFYAPFDPARYQLCFSCHRVELVTSASGTGATNFRDGDRNLHTVHVLKEKGRTCRACHEVHASKKPFHIREAVPFGSDNWMLEIRFEKSNTGGSCAPGCHNPMTYDRMRPMSASQSATRPIDPGPTPGPKTTGESP